MLTDRMKEVDPEFILYDEPQPESASHSVGVLLGLRDGITTQAPMPGAMGFVSKHPTDRVAQVRGVAVEDEVFLSRFGPTGDAYDEWVAHVQLRRTSNRMDETGSKAQ